jgi:hypothetical protein
MTAERSSDKPKPTGRGDAVGFNDGNDHDKGSDADIQSTGTRQTDFAADFAFSTTGAADALVRRACYRTLAGCCGVTRASPAEDRQGVDYWIVTQHQRYGLDLKLRRKDYGRTRGAEIDCVIELESHGTAGWLLKPSGADLLLFACADTQRFAMFNAKSLRIAVLFNLSRWMATGRAHQIKTHSQRNGRTWESAAVIVNSATLYDGIDRLDETDWVDAANDWGPGNGAE